MGDPMFVDEKCGASAFRECPISPVLGTTVLCLLSRLLLMILLSYNLVNLSWKLFIIFPLKCLLLCFHTSFDVLTPIVFVLVVAS